MYSAYKLNNQADNIQPWLNSFPNFEPVRCPCPVLTVASWPAYRFLRRLVRGLTFPSFQESSIVCCDLPSQRLQHSQWSRSRYFSGIFYDPTDVDNWISGSPDFSKASLYIWKFSVHVLLKPSLKDFEYDLASSWNECNCVVVWTFFYTALLWNWNENWHFPVLRPLLGFPNLLAYWVQNFKSIIF